MSEACLNITFAVTNEGMLFQGERQGEKQVWAAFEQEKVTFSLLFSFSETPLQMQGKAKIGDAVRVMILPYRMELYINEILADEEWPCGEHLLKETILVDNESGATMCDGEYVPKEEEAVLGTFQNASGWRPEENVFVGDCMPFACEDAYHVLYLKDRHHHRSKWCLGAHQWSHISTTDFRTWSVHPMAVAIDDPKEGSICTGSWIHCNDKHYLFYAIRTCDGSPATICRSVSSDGYHFEKDRAFSFVLSEKYTQATARDPKMILADDGMYHMLLTTSLKEEGMGCLAHLVSKDLDTWEEMPEPIYTAPSEPECPDYFFKDGFYYLVYSLHGTAYYQYSTKPFSDWITPADPKIPCERVPKAAVWKNRLIFTGFTSRGEYAGSIAFMEAKVLPTGELTFFPVEEV